MSQLLVFSSKPLVNPGNREVTRILSLEPNLSVGSNEIELEHVVQPHMNGYFPLLQCSKAHKLDNIWQFLNKCLSSWIEIAHDFEFV